MNSHLQTRQLHMPGSGLTAKYLPPARHSFSVHIRIETGLDITAEHTGYSGRHFVYRHTFAQLAGRVPCTKEGGKAGEGNTLEESNGVSKAIDLRVECQSKRHEPFACVDCGGGHTAPAVCAPAMPMTRIDHINSQEGMRMEGLTRVERSINGTDCTS